MKKKRKREFRFATNLTPTTAKELKNEAKTKGVSVSKIISDALKNRYSKNL